MSTNSPLVFVTSPLHSLPPQQESRPSSDLPFPLSPYFEQLKLGYHERKMKNTAVLLLSTPMPLARKGVVAAIAEFLVAHNGSILHSDDHLDSGRDLFLSRLEWDLEGFDIPISNFDRHFKPLAEPFQIKYHLALTDYRPKIAILVSGHTHCLADLLYRHSEGDLAGDIAIIISNHPTAKPLADFYRVPFHSLTNPKNSTNPSGKCWSCWGKMWT